MTHTRNLLLYDNAFSIQDALGEFRDLESFQSLVSDWTATNATLSVVSNPYVLPTYYTLKISPTSTSPIVLRLADQNVPGTNDEPLEEISYLSHAIVRSSAELSVSGELRINSQFSGDTVVANATNSTAVDKYNAVRTGSIKLRRGKTSEITNVVGDGTNVVFTGINNFVVGDIIRTHGISPSAYDLVGATVISATATTFTVASSATGTFSPSLSKGYAYITSSVNTGSSPFQKYSGEDVVCRITYTIQGHSVNDELYFMFPVLIDEIAFQRDWGVRAAQTVLPQVYKDIDSTSTPAFPLAKLLSATMSTVTDISEIYSQFFRYDQSEIPAYADGTEIWTKSELVDWQSVTSANRRWLGQFTGRKLIDTIYARDFSDGLTKSWEDSQYEFHQWQLENRFLGTKSGSLQSMKEIVSRYLTGSKYVAVVNEGSFQATIQTLFTETLGSSMGETCSITAVENDKDLAGSTASGYIRFTASNTLSVNDWVSISCLNTDGTINSNFSISAIQVYSRNATHFVVSKVASGATTGLSGVAKELIKITAVDDGADIGGAAIGGYVRFTASNTFSPGDTVSIAVTGGAFDVIDAPVVAATSTHFVIASALTGSTTTGYAYASSSPLITAAASQTKPLGLTLSSQMVLDFTKFTFNSATTGIIDVSRLG